MGPVRCGTGGGEVLPVGQPGRVVHHGAESGVRGLPHRMGARVSAVTGALLLGFASVLLVLGPEGPPTTAGWLGLGLAVPAVALAALAGTARFRRAAFPAVRAPSVVGSPCSVLIGSWRRSLMRAAASLRRRSFRNHDRPKLQ